MLTKQEAERFILEVLGISEMDKKIKASKLDFLDSVMYHVYHTQPFQCVSLVAQSAAHRTRPSFNEIKNAAFEKQGGLCYMWNVFLFYLLKAIGFNTYLSHCTVHCPSMERYPNNHVSLFVKNIIEPGDLYLLDLGIGHPTFQAVSMDFKGESEIFQNAYLQYKYIKRSGKLMRLHGTGDLKKDPWDTFIDGFRVFYSMTVSLTDDVSEFDTCMDEVHINPEVTPFHNTLRAIVYKDKKAIIIINSKLLIETDRGIFQTSVLPNSEAICEAYRKHFPQFPDEVIKSAIQNWTESQK